MMKHDYPGLLRDLTAAKSVRWRVRVEGQRDKKIPIPMGPDEPGFQDHYLAARAGKKIEVSKPERAKSGSLDSLCDDYLEWLETHVKDPDIKPKDKPSPLTLKGHRSHLKRACDVKDKKGRRMGSLNAHLPKRAFVHIQDAYGSKTGAADNCIKALKAAYRWGSRRSGYPQTSDVFQVEKVHRNRGGVDAWTVADMRKFLKHHKPGSMARLWFFLSLSTLSRVGDVHRLGRDHLSDDGILGFQPSKKGSAFVEVPALRQFLDELALHPEHETFMTTAEGDPFASPESMRNRIQDWTAQAGLPKGRTQHGIRKGAAELLAAAGATQYEIMALMSHTEAKTSEIYTKRVERAGLAARAIERLSAVDFESVDHGQKSVVHTSQENKGKPIENQAFGRPGGT